MAGKRLIDAAKLINASTSVAKQHYVLRRQQWDAFTQTSSLAKAVKNQTDRVTVTAAAAVELAKRFNEDSPAWQKQRTADEVRKYGSAEAPESTTEAWRRGDSVPKAPQAHVEDINTPQSPAQAPSVQASTTVQTLAGEHDNGTLSSLRKRELQRQAERQIPAQTADGPVEQAATYGQDTFSERTEHASPGLSSLPRSKMPRSFEETKGSEDTVDSTDFNQDTYPVPQQSPPDAATDDFNPDVFSSPKVSRMLGQAGPESKNPYAGRQKLPPKPLPEMVAAQERWQKNQAAQVAHRDDSPGAASRPPKDITGDAEMQDLAASIARAAQSKPQPTDNATDMKPADAPYELRESRVPSSRFGRIWQYAGLGTSMAFGAVGEGFRRLAGGAGEGAGSLMLSEGNLNRLVAKLSRMRGAALKLGQMISFQDSKVLPPAINAVLQRVQDSADYMPPSQRDEVLVRNLGQDWRELFSHFEEKPFAAASIGQVHKATLKSNGKEVAVKIQYPGVRNSIDSDLNNLSLLLTASRLLPKGLFLDKTIANARVELGWECDYIREAEACTKFRDLLKDEDTVFAVPEVYKEASGQDVLTAEFMHGTAVTKIKDLSQSEGDWIGTQVLRLCLRELMEWRFMQTDPNWTNFLYNRETQKLELLDFGASREFPDKFVEPYVSLLIAASRNERDACGDLSIQLGYLTGRESLDMLKAHVDSIMTLAEPFVGSAPETYDFEDQTITDRVRANIGLMLRERLAPPPEETYSLHRKLSGAFLLCARLKSKVKARGMFADAVKVWEGRVKKVANPS